MSCRVSQTDKQTDRAGKTAKQESVYILNIINSHNANNERKQILST